MISTLCLDDMQWDVQWVKAVHGNDIYISLRDICIIWINSSEGAFRVRHDGDVAEPVVSAHSSSSLDMVL
jgi:hypothetical protein